MDIGYDGYYDDVQPLDAGARGEGMDPELMKRVGFVILGAVGVICLAIVQNMNDISFAVNEVLGEGITDAEARIAQDFATTGGDNYEIINPYAADMTSNTNSFIAQYCAARGEAWDAISLADMQTILRQGNNRFFHITQDITRIAALIAV